MQLNTIKIVVFLIMMFGNTLKPMNFLGNVTKDFFTVMFVQKVQDGLEAVVDFSVNKNVEEDAIEQQFEECLKDQERIQFNKNVIDICFGVKKDRKPNEYETLEEKNYLQYKDDLSSVFVLKNNQWSKMDDSEKKIFLACIKEIYDHNAYVLKSRYEQKLAIYHKMIDKIKESNLEEFYEKYKLTIPKTVASWVFELIAMPNPILYGLMKVFVHQIKKTIQFEDNDKNYNVNENVDRDEKNNFDLLSDYVEINDVTEDNENVNCDESNCLDLLSDSVEINDVDEYYDSAKSMFGSNLNVMRAKFNEFQEKNPKMKSILQNKLFLKTFETLFVILGTRALVVLTNRIPVNNSHYFSFYLNRINDGINVMYEKSFNTLRLPAPTWSLLFRKIAIGSEYLAKKMKTGIL